jgi:amino acid adenylation domain-containing protein
MTAAELPLEPLPADASVLVQTLIEARARETPATPAVVHAGSSLCYAELNVRANRLAHWLIARGVAPDDRVALCVTRSLDMAVGILGILKAGAAYVPLDPEYPRARVGFVLRDCSPVAMVTQGALRAQLPASRLPTVALDAEDVDAPLARSPVHDPDPRALGLEPGHLAYVIYTSGSTGTPKGVMVEHRQLAASTAARHAYYGPSGPFLLLSSMSFDSSVAGIFGTLCAGQTLHIASADAVRDPGLLAAQIGQLGIATLLCVPSLYSHLRECLAESARLTRPLHVIVAGEPCPPALAQPLTVNGQRIDVFNEYGPTEGTVWASVYHCTGAMLSDRVPIGRPIRGVQIHVLDDVQRPVARGTIGEICIGGAGVARGYLNQPELTRQRFIRDPFSAAPKARLYRTGDRGRWRPDGELEFCGRSDTQVKLRGYRIELGEIEAQLMRCAGVREAAVVREDLPGQPRLVAYLSTTGGADAPVITALRAQLEAVLPSYMMPAAFVWLSALPVLPNGKLNRAALPPPEQTAATAAAISEPPVGPVETAVAAIWQRLLGRARVGRGEDFFELGGQSLLAVQLASSLRTLFGVELALRDLFARPRLYQVAACIAAAAGRAPLAPVAVVPRTDPMPVSWAQQRLWFLDQLDPAAQAAYLLSYAWHLRGTLERDALRAALDRIVARHETLRSYFVMQDGDPVQQILPPEVGLQLIEHDLSGLSAAERRKRVRDMSQQEATQRFDLSTGPLIRAQLLRIAPDEHILLLTQHHIISDAWSCGVLLDELSRLYGAFTRGEPDPLPALPIQYADYASWQRQWLRDEVLGQQIEFWRTHLEGAPALLELPTDRPRGAARSYGGGTVDMTFRPELAAGLRQLSQRHGVTLFMTLLAGWAVFLSRLSGQKDLVVGVPVANRQRSEVEPLIGFFVNTLALRVRFELDPTVAGLLSQIRASALDGYGHQDIPFAQVVEALKPPRSLSYNPIFQVMLALDNAPGERDLTLPGLTVRARRPARTMAPFDLCLLLRDSEGELRGQIEYASDLFERASIERMIGQLKTVFEALVADDQCHISALNLMSAAEQQRVLHDWNATAVDFLSGTLTEQLAAQVARIPAAPAVIDGERTLSYAQLDEATDSLAAALQESGVGPEVVVGVALHRSLETELAAWAILKAGGVYLPLDPANPPQRLSFMLADAGARLVITDASVAPLLPQSVPQWHIDTRTVQPGLPEPCGLTPAHAAYLVYTSGSTGTPKGVLVPHSAATNLAFARTHGHDPIGPGDRILAAISVGFDVSIGQLLLPHLSGACVVIAPDLRSLSPEEFWALMEEKRVTHVNSVPSFFDSVLDAPLPPGLALRKVMLGGEVLSGALCRRLRAALPNVVLVNMYGPTETCIDATAYVVPDSVDAGVAVVPIGRPLANYRVYVLDEQQRALPAGFPGELYIGGAGLARGYVGRIELTDERFVPDPFGPPGSRLYRTGDLAIWSGDGVLRFLGRGDRQVKIRGFRVEPDEIEAVLRSHPQIAQAAVISRADRAGSPMLVAYVVVQGTAAEAAGLREYLANQLPAHMVPGAFVFLPALPLTSNGKLDRRALPAPESSASEARTYDPPVGQTETAIARMWQELLGLPFVGRHDNFFALGGHSLLVLKFLAALQARFPQSIPVARVFQCPTPAQLAQVIREAFPPPMSSRHLVVLNQGGKGRPLFCVHCVDGSVDPYLNLVRFLDPFLPVYGLQVAPPAQAEAADLDGLIEAYEQEVRRVQPMGPYRLCGYSSVGGAWAFGLARRLEEHGERVSVFLIDAYRLCWQLHLSSWYQRSRAMLRKQGLLKTVQLKLQTLLVSENHGATRPAAGTVAGKLVRVAMRRKHQPVKGPVVLLRASGMDGPRSWRPSMDGFNGWSRYVPGGIQLIEIDAGHHDMMREPDVRIVVEHLDKLLRA